MNLSPENKIGKASEFSKVEIDSFKEIVVDAGEISENTFDGLIKNEPILLFIPNTKSIKAVGALKIPNYRYKQKVFVNSKSNEKSDNFTFELGWVVSLVAANGKKIVETLSKVPENIYATVRQENKPMKHILEKNGFEMSGQCFKSERDNYNIELYLKKGKKSL